jgi:molybdenum cofactor biosynthesis enzyme MoaA/class 3 adenylate cyclase/ADP-ribose pyrophosphatase YjhB (NUDIX family)
MRKSLKSIVFVDIRGFTKLCDDSSMILSVNDFIEKFYSSVEEHFENAKTKYLGDGSMILIDDESIGSILERIMSLRRAFQRFCRDFSKEKGVAIDLNLGFGLTKGDVIEISKEQKFANIILKDYISPKINLASRLCGLARPYGIIVHKESFPKLPRKLEGKFDLVEMKHIHGLERHSEMRCFVEKTVLLPTEATEITKMNIEVHVTGLCFHNGKLLLCKRGADRDIGATKWAGPGGKILPNTSFEDSLKDIFKKEVGIEICDPRLIDSYFIDSHKIPGLIYYCRIFQGKPFDADNQNSEIRFFSMNEMSQISSDLLPSMTAVRKGFEIAQKFERLTSKLRIVVSQECDLECKFCHEENLIGEYPTQLQNIKDSLVKIGNSIALTKITISGGEPLLGTNVENVFSVCSYLREVFYDVPVSIVTNGLNLTPELLAEIRKHSVSLKISVYGTNADDFRDYTGRELDQYVEHIIAILRQIQDLKIPYSLNFLLRRSLDPKLGSFIDLLNSRGVSPPEKLKVIRMVSPKKTAPDFHRERMQLEESVCYQEPYTYTIDRTFPHRRGLKFKGHNIELYEYPCYLKESCDRCFENWGMVLLPNGSLQICEKALRNRKIKDVVNGLGIPVVTWTFKK